MMRLWAAIVSGLSPRVRGKHVNHLVHVLLIRPIPAGAGETLRRSPPPNICWAYPRGCGGNTSIQSFGKTVVGLSPRVRGKLSADWVFFELPGPIPAGAGETQIGRAHV